MNESPPNSRGSGLEREVERIYRLLGAVTRRRILIKGYEIDVYAEFRRGPISFIVLVECKDYAASRSVSDLDMRSFVAKLLAARECGAADKGVFVTTSNYAKTALATAEQHGVQCLLLEELHNQLVDFRPYLEAIQAEFRASDLSRWYIEQAASDLEDYDSLTAEARGTSIHPSLLEHADHVLFTQEEPRLAVLGNFGTGKTSFCEKYRDLLAVRAQENVSARIPVLVNLREFRSGLDIHQVITNVLQRLPAVSIDLSLCLELQRLGRFLFLLDGLDEMATRVDRSVVNESLREIDRLLSEGNNKYIVTCRTHFFQERIFEDYLVDYRIAYLMEWGRPQMDLYLTKRFASEAQQWQRRITSSPQLEDLARTPLLLDMLVRSDFSAKDGLNLFRLYSDYTDEWITKQSRRRGAIMGAEQRRRFVEALAATLLVEGSARLHFSRLYEVAREFSGYGDATRLDYFDADARTCTFLTRDARGHYGFRHRSFLEYFCAVCLAQDIERGEGKLLGARDLSAEVLEFIVARGLNDKGIDALKTWSSLFEKQVLSRNSVNLLVALRQPLTKEVEAQYRTSTAEWDSLRRALHEDSAAAIERLIESYTPRMLRVAHHILHTYDPGMGPDDLVNETLVRLWELARSGRLEAREEFRLEGYLFGIMRNIALNYARRRSMARSTLLEMNEEIDVIAEATQTPEQEALSAEARARVAQAIEYLPASYREVIRLSYYEELKVKDIAQRLAISEAAAKHRRYRAIKLLAQALR